MPPKQKTWNYNLSSGKKKKKKPIPVSKENIQMGSMEYLMPSSSPLNPMAKIGADYGTDVPRIVYSPTYDRDRHGVYFSSGYPLYKNKPKDVEYFEKAKGLPEAAVTDVKGMSGRGDHYRLTYKDTWLDKRTYGDKTFTRPWTRGGTQSRYEQGTGYQATSKPKDLIGIDPHEYLSLAGDTAYSKFPGTVLGYQPRSYGGLQSYESKLMEGRGYTGDSKTIYEPKQPREKQKYESAMLQLGTLDHELQHRGFKKWREIVWQDKALRERLENKYGRDHPVLNTLLYDEHPYIYYQSKVAHEKKYRVPKDFTRQVKEMVDQEILPYFFKRIPSLKDADSLQGPAYGDVKGRGTIMKKRKYQTEKKKGTASYAVKTRGKAIDDDKYYTSPYRVYKGTWNY